MLPVRLATFSERPRQVRTAALSREARDHNRNYGARPLPTNLSHHDHQVAGLADATR
jgi:hypothetical protein